ncbi:MAG: outer membrane protein assembly factor BamE [Pseudomonadales bacterium]
MRMAILTAVFLSLILSGCSLKRPRLPRVHKITVQQGNVITQDMIDKLKPGMSRSQVAFIMGEPVMRNSFDDNRWDYVYSIELPGVFSTTQVVSLYFVDEELAYFTGDLAPKRTQPAAETPAASAAAAQGTSPGSEDSG